MNLSKIIRWKRYSLAGFLFLATLASGQVQAQEKYRVYFGTYKKKNGHSIHVDKANKFALCCDLGLDKVIIYACDASKGTLTAHGAFDTPKGAGPRHFAWHPDGKTAYVNG